MFEYPVPNDIWRCIDPSQEKHDAKILECLDNGIIVFLRANIGEFDDIDEEQSKMYVTDLISNYMKIRFDGTLWDDLEARVARLQKNQSA